MVTSPYKWKILEWDDKLRKNKQTNTQTNKQTNILQLLEMYFAKQSKRSDLILIY